MYIRLELYIYFCDHSTAAVDFGATMAAPFSSFWIRRQAHERRTVGNREGLVFASMSSNPFHPAGTSDPLIDLTGPEALANAAEDNGDEGIATAAAAAYDNDGEVQEVQQVGDHRDDDGDNGLNHPARLEVATLAAGQQLHVNDAVDWRMSAGIVGPGENDDDASSSPYGQQHLLLQQEDVQQQQPAYHEDHGAVDLQAYPPDHLPAVDVDDDGAPARQQPPVYPHQQEDGGAQAALASSVVPHPPPQAQQQQLDGPEGTERPHTSSISSSKPAAPSSSSNPNCNSNSSNRSSHVFVDDDGTEKSFGSALGLLTKKFVHLIQVRCCMCMRSSACCKLIDESRMLL
jgi:hypothetical protein